MRLSSREEIQEDFRALRAVVSRVVGHSFDVLTTPERLVCSSNSSMRHGGFGFRATN
jgi:hypothetical protein